MAVDFFNNKIYLIKKKLKRRSSDKDDKFSVSPSGYITAFALTRISKSSKNIKPNNDGITGYDTVQGPRGWLSDHAIFLIPVLSLLLTTTLSDQGKSRGKQGESRGEQGGSMGRAGREQGGDQRESRGELLVMSENKGNFRFK